MPDNAAANSTINKIEDFKTATAAVIRALSGNRTLDVNFAASEPLEQNMRSYGPETITRVPMPETKITQHMLNVIRGAADARGLRFKHHKPSIHKQYAPQAEVARRLFDVMEQARIEAIGANHMQGIAKNLNALLIDRVAKLNATDTTLSDPKHMAEAMHIYAYKTLANQEIPENAQALLSAWQTDLEKKIPEEKLKQLTTSIHNQKKFAQSARDVIRYLNLDPSESDLQPDDSEEDTSEQQQKEQDKSNPDQDQDQQDDNSHLTDDAGEQAEDEHEDSAETGHEDEENGKRKSPTPDENQDGDVPFDHRIEKLDPTAGPKTSYNIYTAQYDEIIKAEDLADIEDLYRLRQLLDKQLDNFSGVIAKLANRLQRKLMARQQRTWLFDLEEGYLDSARLARVVANPTIPLTFKQEKETDFKDTIVTLLLDNSGSMRGRPITIAAMCADVLARTLERCGVKVEILGFTTRAWKGGKSRELWIENGRPQQPGRLNDLRHIIYKSADAPWRRVRKNLGLMLKEGLLKENIDGEALAWAYNRIAQRPEDRKILMVISDGAPVDDSTLSVNPSNILERDLRTIIGWIENHSDITLTAIGIGHDVTRYYNRALTISDVDELGEALINKLSELFEDNDKTKKRKK